MPILDPALFSFFAVFGSTLIRRYKYRMMRILSLRLDKCTKSTSVEMSPMLTFEIHSSLSFWVSRILIILGWPLCYAKKLNKAIASSTNLFFKMLKYKVKERTLLLRKLFRHTFQILRNSIVNNLSIFQLQIMTYYGRHRSIVSSAPTILRPWVWIQSTPSTLFSICIIEIGKRKGRK